MNKNMIIIGIIVVVAIGAFVLLYGQQSSQAPKETMESETLQEEVNQPQEATDGAMEKEDAMVVKTVIETKSFAFVNKTYTVKAGETVTFKNLDIPGHSVTSDDGKSFDTRVVGKDQTATFKAPAKAGSYPFHCTPHPNMKATLVVE